MHSSRVSRIRLRRRLAALCVLSLPAATLTDAQSLLGSRESLLRQNDEARDHDFTYLRTSADVRDFARRGLLVRVPGNGDYDIESDEVSFPYARPEVKLFIERLSEQYRAACGEKLVVTSLTRPITRQPWNASTLSVHPTGMAADLRRSGSSACRGWLETVLLDLEGKGVLEATKEQYPPHYHVTVFPQPYLRYIASDDQPQRTVIAAKAADDDPAPSRVSRASSRRGSRSSRSHTAVARSKRGSRTRTVVASHHRSSHGKSTKSIKLAKNSKSNKKYRVGRGDSLWKIAQKSGVSVSRIKQANRIRSHRLKAGQVISIPAGR
jgi:LysM repeat protein